MLNHTSPTAFIYGPSESKGCAQVARGCHDAVHEAVVENVWTRVVIGTQKRLPLLGKGQC